MATAWELKQQEAAARLAQRKQIGAVAGAVVDVGKEAVIRSAIQQGGAQAAIATNIQTGSLLATVVNVVGGIGIAAWQYLSGKKAQKKKERLLRKQQQTHDAATGVLETIAETGNIIVTEHGVDPTTAEFEKIMYDNLFQTVGYRGNCNARVWMPGSKPGQPNRPVWFTVDGNGRRLTPVNLKNPPPNFQEYWYTECRNAKDTWANTYMQMLIQQGRAQELADFQAAHTSGTKYIRIGFGIIAAILLFIIIRNMTRIK